VAAPFAGVSGLLGWSMFSLITAIAWRVRIWQEEQDRRVARWHLRAERRRRRTTLFRETSRPDAAR
jgi:hypothetical protein